MPIRHSISAASLLLGTAYSPAAAGDAGALAALEDAAARGDVAALTALATRYEHAEGVPRDYGRAGELYCAAAKRGHADAQFALGWMYANGRGGLRDDDVAGLLFKLAADRGHEQAARLQRYLAHRPDTSLPPCMRPDPPVAASPAETAPADTAKSEDRAPAPSVAALKVPADIREIVARLAPQYAVEAELVLAVIAVESAFDALAVSAKNAQGLMQLMPETADRFGVKKVFNPVENIKGGLAYLRWLLAFFEGDVELVVAAYNAGERAVERHKGIPPYLETRSYVRKIGAIYPKRTHPYQAGITAPSPIVARYRAGR